MEQEECYEEIKGNSISSSPIIFGSSKFRGSTAVLRSILEFYIRYKFLNAPYN